VDKEQLRVVNKMQIIALVLTGILSFVPTVGLNDGNRYYGVPLQSFSYNGSGYFGMDVNMWALIANFILIYYMCKIGLKLWRFAFKRL